jgi:hypothetical protein
MAAGDGQAPRCLRPEAQATSQLGRAQAGAPVTIDAQQRPGGSCPPRQREGLAAKDFIPLALAIWPEQDFLPQ